MNMLAAVRVIQTRLEGIEQRLDAIESEARALNLQTAPQEPELAGSAWPPPSSTVVVGVPHDGTEEPYRQLDLGLSTDGMGGVVVTPVDEPPEPVVAATTYG